MISKNGVYLYLFIYIIERYEDFSDGITVQFEYRCTSKKET